jgi:hypothetical protein
MKHRSTAGLLWLLLLLAFAPAGRAATDPATGLQKSFSAADRLAPGLIWGGRAPSGIPVLIQMQGRSWLWGHPSAPSEFQPVGKGRLRRHTGRMTTIGDVTHLGGVSLPVMHLAAEDLADPALPGRIQRARYLTLMEECAGLPDVDNSQVFHWPREDARLYRLQLEADVCFKRALAAADAHNRQQWSWLALESEKARRALLPRAQADWEHAVLTRAFLATWAGAAGGKPGKPAIPEWGFEPNRPVQRLQAVAEALAWLLDQIQPGCPAPCGSGTPADPRDELRACLPGPKPPVRSLSPMDQANLGNAVSERLRLMSVNDRLAQMAYSTQAGWTLVIQASPEDPLWVLAQDPARIQDLGKAGLLYDDALSARNQSTTLDIVEHSTLVRSFSGPGGRDLARVELAGLKTKPVVTQKDDRIWISADGLMAEFTQAGFAEQGTVLLVNLPPSLVP